MRVIDIKFKGATNPYAYESAFDVKPGDKVVVDTPSNGLVVVQVSKVHDESVTVADYKFPLKQIVDVVDVDAYKQRLG